MNAVYNPGKTQPFAQWQLVDITFSATADTDTPVEHNLTPPTPEHVNYLVMRTDCAGVVYHDTTYNRTAWRSGVIQLRNSVASARATLLLWVEHDQRTLSF